MSSLVIDIRAQFAQLLDGLDQIKGKVSNVSSVFDGLKSTLGTLGVALSAGAVAGGFKAMVQDAANAQDEIGKMSQKIGIATEQLSALAYAASLSDVPLEALQVGLKKLSTAMFETQANTGEAKDVFKALHVEVEATKGVLKPTEQVILELADKFSKMEDGAGKTAIAVRLFGKSGADLIPLLNQGAKGLADNAEEARKFGIIISKEASQAAEQFNDNLKRLSEQSRGFGLAIANSVLPFLNKMVERFIELRDIGGGTLGALKIIAQQSFSQITSEPGENIKNLNAELDELRSKITRPQDVRPDQGVGKRIEEIKKQIEWEKFLQKQQALSITGGDTPGERARIRVPLEKAPALPDKDKIKAAADVMEAFRDQMRKFSDESRSVEGLNSEFLKMRDLLSDKRFAGLPDSFKQQLLDAAEALDELRDKQKQNKELEEGLAQNAKEESDARNKQTAELAALTEKYKDLADPLRVVARQQAEINQLASTGWITEQEAALARLSDQLRGLIAPVHNIFDEIQTSWQNGVITTEQMSAALEKLQGPMQKTNDLAKDIGLIFESAFEKAASAGAKFKDILKALAQDIAKLVLRKTVTQPLVNFISGLFSTGAVSGAKAGGGPVSGGRTYLVGEQGPELFTPSGGGMIIPNGAWQDGGVTIVQNNNFALGLNAAVRDVLNAESPRIADMAVRAVRAERNRTGDQR